MKLHKLLLTVILGSFLFVSCSSDDNNDSKPSGAYDNGVIVLNQGNFLKGNASISFLSNSFVTENNIFSTVNNGAVLGDTGQDIGFKGDLAYIVLNVSNKIEIVNRYTFAKVATISNGLVNPRYIAFHNDKAYVTNWGDGNIKTDDYVAVIDLKTNTVTGTIPVVEGPERIIEENGKLYVAHAGGFGYGNTITVIKTANNTIETTITVGDVPNSIETENGKLYVLTSGKSEFSGSESAGKFHIITLNDNKVTTTLDFTGLTHPSNLVIEDNRIYYTLNNDVYTMTLAPSVLPATSLFSTTAQGVKNGINCFAVEDSRIYVGDALDFNSNGKVYVYSLQGALQHSTTVGLIPAGFYFND
ncbi:YncE family protein [Flavobacterium cerinum]|uniref:YncE family protein n=1 Tax=Flavobacterium cerinum TaxID=2502784 RepID=A0A444HC47_9FLAO|nr:DUF5074 domain-containing protein [Flavobacterium cerinum]RWX01044.1 hypothetical protein EPI11_08465 [Flavobacterium cerinum]